MDRRAEFQLWKEVQLALRRVRDRVFLSGLAGRLHAGKGSRIVDEPGSMVRWVEAPYSEEDRAAAYLASLPRRIGRTTALDEECGRLWDQSRSGGSAEAFIEARSRLARHLLGYRFRLRYYEQLVRQPEKPNLERAVILLEGGRERGPEAVALEGLVRMTLREFVELEGATEADLKLLDELRSRVVSAYEWFASGKAESIAGSDPDAAWYARCGLIKAAEYYLPRRGYRFPTYAETWIEASIVDKKSWKIARPG